MVSRSEHVCCFTGHRDIARCDENKIMARVRHILQRLLVEKGVETFIVGGAIGFDMMAAEEIIRRKKTSPRICLISILPFPGYDSTWPSALQERARRIRLNCSEVIYASQEASKEAYLLRDRMMVERADCCISFCNQRTGGTVYTVRYAFEKDIPVYNASSWDITQLKPRMRMQSSCKQYRRIQ